MAGVLTVEEQIYDLGVFLRQKNKCIHAVDRDGMCILKSFKEGYHAIGVDVTLDGLKDVLKEQIYEDVEFYQTFSDRNVDVIQEVNLYLQDPAKYYSLSTVDLFLDAIGKGMSTRVCVFNIDATGKINETCVGSLKDYKYELFFAKYSILHIDPILCESTVEVEEICDGLDLHNLTTEQLLNAIWMNEKYLVDKPLKGVRKDLMYTIRGASLNSINCDDNGAYENYSNTKKPYYVFKTDDTVTQVTSVHWDSAKKKFYYNVRVGRAYSPRYVSANDVYTLERNYRRNKSIPGLKHLTVRVKFEGTQEYNDCICVVYTCDEEKDDGDEVTILPHKNTKRHDKPYIRTLKQVLDEEDQLLGTNQSSSDTYDKVYSRSGGALKSTSQSDEPRDIQQTYRRKSMMKKNQENDGSSATSSDEVMTLVEGQKSRELIQSIVTIKDKYFIVLLNEKQIQDITIFCTTQNAGVLGVDTTYNLCNLWLTDTCYRNKRLINPKTQKHPVFLGPSFFHFTKDEDSFMRFGIELLASHKEMRNLKRVGVDLESAIFNGLKIVFPNLESLVCVKHIDGRDSTKLDKLLATVAANKVQKGRAKSEILKDIYGAKYGSVQELGLAEAFDKEDFDVKLLSLEGKWNSLCPGFYSWFKRKRSDTFCSSIIQSAREGTDVVGLFYNNDIESMHYVEKLKQAFQKMTVLEVIDSLQKIISRQEEQEMLAIYGAGSYVLAQPWKDMFGRDSAMWHSWTSEERKKHVTAMRKYVPTCSDSFSKPENCGRKPGQRTKKRKQVTPDIIVDRFTDTQPPAPISVMDDENQTPLQPIAVQPQSTFTLPEASETIRFADPREKPPQVFQVHFRQKLPRAIERCRGNCGVKITPNDKGLLVRTYGTTRWTNKTTGAQESRHGPLYIHFQDECLRKYDSATYYGPGQTFDYKKLTIDKEVQIECNDTEKCMLISLGVRFL